MARVSAGRVGIVGHSAPAQTERAHLRSVGKRCRAGDLGQPAGGGTTHQLHLEHAIARVHKPDGGGGISGVGGMDARDAVGVEADIDRPGETRDARLL